MNNILIIIPSRNRADILDRLLKSWQSTTDINKCHISVVLDVDDYHNYDSVSRNPVSALSYNYFPERRHTLVEKLNLESHFTLGWGLRYETIGFVGDDCVFMTPGWENTISTWQKEHRGICYCNDLLQGETLPNNVFIHHSIIRALGFMVPWQLKHYYIDNYWKDLGLRLNNIKYFPEIVIEHRHWSNTKASKDVVYEEAEKFMGIDREVWDKYREEELAIDVTKVINYQSSNF